MERKKPRILVVDDHEDNIELLRARLEARGYDVDGAKDGQEALDQVDRACPDLILLDVMMPKMDGMEVVRRLKARTAANELPFIPVIMQTALDSTENKVEGLDAGADDYITKPINFAELEARVNSLLRIKGLQSSLAARESWCRGCWETGCCPWLTPPRWPLVWAIRRKRRTPVSQLALTLRAAGPGRRGRHARVDRRRPGPAHRAGVPLPGRSTRRTCYTGRPRSASRDRPWRGRRARAVHWRAATRPRCPHRRPRVRAGG